MTDITLLLDYSPDPVGPLEYWWDEDATATSTTPTTRYTLTWAADGTVTDQDGTVITADPVPIVGPASDDAAYTNQPRRLWLVERFTNVRRNPLPYALQLLLANGLTQRLGDLRLAAIGATAPDVTTIYVSSITSADESVTVTRAGGTVDLAAAAGGHPFETAAPLADSGAGSAGTATTVNRGDHVHPLSSAYATAAGLTSEATTRATADTTLQTNITAEATARAAADSTHAALTTTAHGGIVADTDPRLSDARTPTAHASTHVTGGGDVIPAAVASGNAGLLTGTDKAKLDGIAAGAQPGTVTSVAATVPSGFSVSGSPITGAGTLAISETTQSANTVKAGPTTGAAATPAYRALVIADLPTVRQSDLILARAIGKPSASAVVGRFDPPSGYNFSIPTNATNSIAKATTAATASTTFSLQKNGVQFGTVVFSAAGTTGAWTVTATSFTGGTDYLTIVAPSSADATLADLYITLVGSLS